MKNNAKEYLIEFAQSQENWLKALVYETIETNGSISKERKKTIFNCLQDSTEIEYSIPNAIDSNDEIEIILTKLVHKKGVNALSCNQTIKFNNNVTILHGLNGTGKSGYFKIINEIVGGNKKKEILPNIYSENPSKIDIEITYKDSLSEKTIPWNGSPRSLPSLNKCKVFDTSYLNGLLETRETDSTLIQPLSLNLFTYLIDSLDIFKNQLTTNANKIRSQKPNIDITYFSEQNQSTFNNHNLPESRKKEIEKLFEFSDTNSKRLDELIKELITLKQVNIQDKIKLILHNKNCLENLKNWLENKSKILSDNITVVKQLVVSKKEKQIASNKAREQFMVLTDIPSVNSNEWKEFIIAGRHYSSILKEKDGICPYCRQELKSDKSVQILQSYCLFLKDNSERELHQSLNLLQSKLKELELLSFDYQLEENISQIFKEKFIEEKNLYDISIEIINSFNVLRSHLTEIIKKEDLNISTSAQNVIPINNCLNDIIKKLQAQIDVFSKEDSEKKEKIKVLEQKIKVLQENKSIYIQKNSIKKWIILTIEESALKKKANKINTRQLSTLSKAAHDHLLTESLKQKFNKELIKIGYQNLDVKIVNAGIRKGISSTKLVLTRNNAITTILSEGEQKAVALALFIAEIKMQKVANPIILDDPVNSLDHRIAGNFAERLLSLDNQIIIFNHNRLFLDSFETSKTNHICKTTDTDCNNNQGKHIKVYEVISQGKNSKGILRNYKGNYAKNHIKEAKTLLHQTPFLEENKVANLIRISVECIIDEVIFNHQVPTRFSNKNSRIAWAELKKINNNAEIVDSLHRIHSRVSGGMLHNGTERNENTIDLDEFNDMITDIENILIPNARA
ncbi:MAG: hypothetical protein PHS54_06050 [Clostridia bacterium]|nr:hypothetical protein [Clostridia bacterium]